jgi:hypothetical protein
MTADKSCVRIVGLIFGISLTIGVAQVQSQLLTGTPTESPSPPKQRTEKRTEATPPVESGASPSAAESPAASPTPRRIRKKTTAEMSPSPTPTPVASPTPRKIRFPRLFKPKRSPSPTPAGVKPAPVSGTANQENGTLYARADWPVDASPERLCSSDGSKAANPC